MNGEDIRAATKSDETFKMYVVETLGGVKANVETLTTQNAEQFAQLRELEQKKVSKGDCDTLRATLTAPSTRKIMGGGAVAATGVTGVFFGIVKLVEKWLETP